MGMIEINGVSKKYKRYRNRRARLWEWMSAGRKSMHQEYWALRGVSFTVRAGEAIGIVGQNGAGKSTLLKILTGTTKPSEGTVKVRGSVSALLELGMGFHPDFTGRQNAHMAGQLTGLSNERIRQLMPDIERFAEIGTYMDQPLRTYSSGMAVRVAFAAATAVRPDVLIVDEALSVGDAYFQYKCFERIKTFKEQGTTLLFVSHDPGAVKTLCDRAMFLDRGVLAKEGGPEEVLDYYNARIGQKDEAYDIVQTGGQDGHSVTRSGNGLARIVEAAVYSKGRKVGAVSVGDEIEVRVRFECNAEIHNPTVGILFKDRLGNDMFGTNSYHHNVHMGDCASHSTCGVVFAMTIHFGAGHYSLSAAVTQSGPSHIQGNLDWWDHALTLQVVPGAEHHFIGLCHNPATCSVMK